jgi:hypothetical protein
MSCPPFSICHRLREPGKIAGRELYSLNDDPEERKDIAKKQPEKVKRYYHLMMKIMDGIRENLIRLKKMKTPGLSNTDDLKNQLKALGYLGN